MIIGDRGTDNKMQNKGNITAEREWEIRKQKKKQTHTHLLMFNVGEKTKRTKK